jgi:hypothetical protein
MELGATWQSYIQSQVVDCGESGDASVQLRKGRFHECEFEDVETVK